MEIIVAVQPYAIWDILIKNCVHINIDKIQIKTIGKWHFSLTRAMLSPNSWNLRNALIIFRAQIDTDKI